MEDLFKKWMKQEMKEPERPEMLPAAVAIYDNDSSEIPDRLKVSFISGKTAMYVLQPEMPAPLIRESIRIIRKWRTGYEYQQPRRRRNRR